MFHLPAERFDWRTINWAALGVDGCEPPEHQFTAPDRREKWDGECKCGELRLTATPTDDGGWDIDDGRSS